MLRELALFNCDNCIYQNICFHETEMKVLSKMEHSYPFIEINCKFFKAKDIDEKISFKQSIKNYTQSIHN